MIRRGSGQWWKRLAGDSIILRTAGGAADETLERVYVDGSHIFESVFIDSHYCARLVSLDAFVCSAAGFHLSTCRKLMQKRSPAGDRLMGSPLPPDPTPGCLRALARFPLLWLAAVLRVQTNR